MGMRRTLSGLVVAQALLVSAASAQSGQSVTLWRNIKAGMTMSQVLAVLPGSSLADDGKSVAAPATNVAGLSLQPYIGFVNNRASEVSLVGNGLLSEVRTSLSAKYGRASKPLSCSSPVSLCTETWLAPNNVSVTLLQMTGPKGSGVMITYEAVNMSNL